MSLYKKIFFYSIGVLTALCILQPALSAQTQAGSKIINQAKVIFTYKSFPAETLMTNTYTYTVLGVPARPCYITADIEPRYLFGQSGQDSSQVTVVVQDTLHNALQEGISVVCTTDLGTFTNGLQTITLAIVNGKAQTYLQSATVQNDKKTATVTASTLKATGETITASAQAVMYPGAVTGTVMNGSLQTPYQGAIALVTDQSRILVGSDTTGSDGRFFIALNKRVTMYHLQIIVLDQYGDTVVSNADIDPAAFPHPAIRIPNVIAGRIRYRENGNPIPASGVTIYLDSIPRTMASGIRGAAVSSIIYSRVLETKSDELGRFQFNDLPPAFYRLSIDSTKFQNYSGQRIIADTTSGTFTINVNIDVSLDSLIDLQMDAVKIASAGDTLRYAVSANNFGNVNHYQAALTDTLPAQASFVSMRKGTFSAASYDSVSRIVKWSADTLKVNSSDSASVTLILPRNIPDSTVINNTVWYSSPGEQLKFHSTAATVIRSQSVLTFSSYFSGRDSVAAGDSVLKVYTYRNTGTDSLRAAAIIDTLYRAGSSTFSLVNPSDAPRIKLTDSVVTISLGSIAPGRADTVTIKLVTDRKLVPGTRIRSSTRFMRNGVTVDSTASELPIVDKINWAMFLKISKTANKKVAEIGDIVTYQIQITNAYSSALHGIGVYDLLPHAFKYVKNSARWNNRPLEPLLSQSVGGLTWGIADTIAIAGTASLVYQVALGADALESQGMNTAYASANTVDGLRLLSDPSQWQVTIRPGVFTEKGLVIGKVFYDDDRNSFQEEGETGIKDVELWMEDGTRITTGDDGKFSVPELKPGQHVLRVNERTLPAGTELMDGSNEFARDPVSRFVRVTESGIAKANFFVKRNMRDSIGLTAVRSMRSTAMRQAVPKYVFKSEGGKPSADTVDMIVAFTYKGDKFLQHIEVDELLPSEFQYVENSARFNNRTFAPLVKGDSLIWNLGRAASTFSGALRYKVVVTEWPESLSTLRTSSVIALMTADSDYMTSAPLVTENIVKHTDANGIESSREITTFVPPTAPPIHADTVSVTTGDEITFTTVLRIDVHKKPRSVVLADSLASWFILNDRSFTLNSVPMPNDRVSTSSSPIPVSGTSVTAVSIDLTNLLRTGKNIVSYSAQVQRQGDDTTFSTISRVTAVDQYNERRNVSSENIAILYKAKKPEGLKTETGFVQRERVESKKIEPVKIPVLAANVPVVASKVPVVAAKVPVIAEKIPVVAPSTETTAKPVVRTIAPQIDSIKTFAHKTLTRKDSIHTAVLPVPRTISEWPLKAPLKKELLSDEHNRPDWLVYKRISSAYMVQVSSWESKDKAASQAERFAHLYGIQPVLYEHFKEGKVYYGVQFGPFKSETEARAAIDAYPVANQKESGSRNVGPSILTPSHEVPHSEWIIYRRISGVYMVQVSSWESQDKAIVQAERFTRTVGPKTVLFEHYKDGKIYYAVQFGPFRTEIEARAAIVEYNPVAQKKGN